MSFGGPPFKNFKLAYLNTSSTNIPTTYGTGAGSLVLTGVGGEGYSHMKIVNETSSRIAIALAAKDDAVPDSSTSTNTNQDIVSATSTEFKDDIHIYDKVYLRSDSGSAITSGIVAVVLW